MCMKTHIRTSRQRLMVVFSLVILSAGGCSQYKPAGPTEAAGTTSAPPQSVPEQPAE